MKTIKFDKELIKAYGEQIWRDHARTKNGYDFAAETSSYVAEGCGEIKENDREKFKKAILKYARTHKKPKGFI